MFSSEDIKARYNNGIVVSAINSLAETVHAILSLEMSGYIGEGATITYDLDILANILLDQIIGCVPREKHQAILSAHGLDDYTEELDDRWNDFIEKARND